MSTYIKRNILYLLLVLSGFSFGQREYQIYSGMIYNFAITTEWAPDKSNSEFVIGVVGNSPVVSELHKIAQSKKINDAPIVIKEFKSATEIENCHIIFVAPDHKNELEEISELSKLQHSILITEGSETDKEYFIFNFINDGQRTRYQLNMSNAAKHDVRIPSSIITLAIIVG